MDSFFDYPALLILIVSLLLLLLAFQFILLLRIRKLLKRVSSYVDSITRYLARIDHQSVQISRNQPVPKTCQFCKYRLSYINMKDRESEVEDFYYKCRLRNIEVTLEDSCDRFETDYAS
ncbi:MAG: hypothetical protein JXL67_09735 [Calditrichaeota bacterium]|nr:hypothetical protein [Calditrichota bacterium]